MMAKFTSRFPKLAFYVNGELKRFNNGQYNTDNQAEIEALIGLADAQRVDEPKVAETKTEAKPATKAPARKASAK